MTAVNTPSRLERAKRAVIRDAKQNVYLYIMLIPVIAYYIIFKYAPMYGAIIAFKDFSPGKGIIASKWAGFTHFQALFSSIYFTRILKNTLLISVYSLAFGFPAPILLALLLNEMRIESYKRLVQTISYIPHFISVMVICGMIIDFTSSAGVINDLVAMFGGTRKTMLLDPAYFRTIYVTSGIWQQVGWNSIIYLSALAAVDPQLYEAAAIDGAGKLRQAYHITLPGIKPTIVILLIMNIGRLMNVGFEKVILLYNPNVYSTADVISSFVYRKGLMEFSYSFSTAVGLFNSAINFFLLIMANFISRSLNETSLW